MHRAVRLGTGGFSNGRWEPGREDADHARHQNGGGGARVARSAGCAPGPTADRGVRADGPGRERLDGLSGPCWRAPRHEGRGGAGAWTFAESPIAKGGERDTGHKVVVK